MKLYVIEQCKKNGEPYKTRRFVTVPLGIRMRNDRDTTATWEYATVWPQEREADAMQYMKNCVALDPSRTCRVVELAEVEGE